MLQERGIGLSSAELVQRCGQCNSRDVMDVIKVIKERKSAGVWPGFLRVQKKVFDRGADVVRHKVNADVEQPLAVVQG